MSEAEIADMLRQLRTIRYSPRHERMGRRAPSLRSIARLSGVSHMTIYRIIGTGRISAKVAAVLAPAIEAVTFPYKPGPPFTEKERRPIPVRIDIRAHLQPGGKTIRQLRLKS
jgi:lactate dehydrogenase-like 2-hydroxyacid dehydrogenase